MIKKLIIDINLEKCCQVFLLIITFLAPLKSTILAIFFIILIDFITGIWASIKLKIPITSKQMRNSIGKFTAYILCIIAAHIFQETFGLKDANITKAASFFIAFIELKSVIENVSKITEINLWNKIKSVLSGKKSFKDVILDDDENKSTTNK